MKKSARPTYWHQGLFLQPHHFQYQELFVQSQAALFRSSISPYLWGVSSLLFRTGALEENVVEVLEGTLTFQDGTTLSIPDSAIIQPRSFRDIADSIKTGEPITVWLALRRLDPAKKNCTTVLPGDSLVKVRTRFVTTPDPETASNLYEGGDEAGIGFMQYLVQIVWGHEIADYGDYHCIPVATVESAGDTLQYGRAFIPPSLSIASSPALLELVRDIQDSMLSRAKLLGLYKLSRPLRAEDIEGSYFRYLEALRSINHFIPLLQQMLDAPSAVHPWTAYGLLCSLIGELSTFTERINALGKLSNGTELIHPYSHEEPYRSFEEVRMLVGELLNSVIIGDENIIELERDGSRFIGRLPAEAFDSRNIVCLMIRAQGEDEEVINSILNHAKAGPLNTIDVLISRALEGVTFDYQLTPPPGIPVHPDGYIFRIDRSGEVWENIREENSICLYWDEATEDAIAEITIARK